MIDLAPFCSREPTRPYLNSPFNLGDFSYACNGHILVRVKKREEAQPFSIPSGEKSFMRVAAPLSNESLTFFPLPNIREHITFEECRDCRGSGYTEACVHCGGEGFKECPTCEHEEDCDDCAGSGFIPSRKNSEGSTLCERCLGVGSWPAEKGILLAPSSSYSPKYLLLLEKLPGIEVSPVSPANDNPMVFRFEGGIGLLMPLRCSEADIKLYAEAA